MVTIPLSSRRHLVELVPRSIEGICEEALAVTRAFDWVKGINVPDLTRLVHRSDVVAMALAAHHMVAIPHLRVCDHSASSLLALIGTLQAAGVESVLLISGDGAGKGTHCVAAIRLVAHAYPSLKVYAAFDPYRQAMSDENQYADQKLDAGAHGLFTQPFFDLDLAQSVLTRFGSVPLYMGVSPVLTPKSKAYWESVNKVPFPDSFEPTLDWNTRFTAEMLQVSESMGQQVYIMPIRCEVMGFLSGVSLQLGHVLQ